MEVSRRIGIGVFIFASQNNLDNLVVIIDYNKLGATDFINNTGNLSPLKIVSFGFDVLKLMVIL